MRTHIISFTEVSEPVRHRLAVAAHGDGRRKMLVLVYYPAYHRSEYEVVAVQENVRSDNSTHDSLRAAVKAYNAIDWV